MFYTNTCSPVKSGTSEAGTQAALAQINAY
jgi:hypothetical protein